MTDEELTLLKIESKKNHDIERKAEHRFKLYKLKMKGYNHIQDHQKAVVTIFLGFLAGVGLLDDPEIVDALCDSVYKDNYMENITNLLKRRFSSKADIIEVLHH